MKHVTEDEGRIYHLGLRQPEEVEDLVSSSISVNEYALETIKIVASEIGQVRDWLLHPRFTDMPAEERIEVVSSMVVRADTLVGLAESLIERQHANFKAAGNILSAKSQAAH